METMFDRMVNLMNGTVAAIGQAQQANLLAAMRGLELMTNSYSRLWGQPAREVLPPDSRFQASAWNENQAVDALKQAYLITARWMEDIADSLQPIDPVIHHRTKFWTRQLADAMSPTNFALANPEVMEKVIQTGGANLVKGLQNFLSDLQQGSISQVPRDSFQVGKDLAVTPGKVIYRNPLIELIQYTPATERVRTVPILVIPPWINKYYVMDLSPDNSLFGRLVDSGFTVFTISWKNPDRSILDLEWDDYMDLGPLDALRVVKEVTGSEKVNAVGYCLGGIIQQVTLAYLSAMDDKVVNTATYFATHQDFSNAGDVTVFISEPEVRLLELLMMTSGGYLDGRLMASTFNMLRANDLLWNYIVQNYLLGEQPPPFDILYWNSDGTRIPGRVHSFLVREFFLENKLKEPNGIRVKGVGVDLSKITVPSYCVAARGDHIVPWEGTFLMRELQGGPVRFVLTTGGHIAGIINPPEKKKREYWLNNDRTTDPETWFQGAKMHKGSWWVDWIPWLKRRSGGLVDPPSMGSQEFPPILDAPGTYVLE